MQLGKHMNFALNRDRICVFAVFNVILSNSALQVLEYNDTKDTANPTTPGNFNVTLESLRRLRWNISTNGDVVWMKVRRFI